MCRLVVVFAGICAALTCLVGCSGTSAAVDPSPTAFLGPLRRQQVGDVNYAYYRFGQGKPLVLVCAFGTTMSNWTKPLLEALAQKYEVVIFDNRGLGLSSDAYTGELTIQLMAESTIGLIDALQLKKPNVLGWSLGAETCFAMAALHPGKIGKVISVGGDVGGAGTLPATPEFLAVVSNPSATVEEACSVLFPPGHQAEIDRFLAGWRAMPDNPANPDGEARQLEAYEALLADESLWNAMPTLANRVLLITGAEDLGCPPGNSETLVKRIPNATLFEVSDAGHAVLFQEQELCLGAIDAFLGRD